METSVHAPALPHPLSWLGSGRHGAVRRVAPPCCKVRAGMAAVRWPTMTAHAFLPCRLPPRHAE